MNRRSTWLACCVLLVGCASSGRPTYVAAPADAQDAQVCPRCVGKGFLMVCPICEGTGRSGYITERYTAAGISPGPGGQMSRGQVMERNVPVTCRSCGGTGKGDKRIGCPLCKGSGKVYPSDKAPPAK
jgi:DnaJ-class molecular chaperone